MSPGCGRPPDWCIAHHLLHWALGGPTDIWNLILLCRYHHHAVHEGGWIITLNPDNTVTCRPPGAVAA
jgi:predicted restriction endonuclease